MALTATLLILIDIMIYHDIITYRFPGGRRAPHGPVLLLELPLEAAAAAAVHRQALVVAPVDHHHQVVGVLKHHL